MYKSLSKVLLFCLTILSLVFSHKVQAQETATNSGTFDLNPEQKDASEYNLLPLILDGGVTLDSGTKTSLLVNMIEDQGYEAQCAQQEWYIEPSVWGSIQEYFARYETAVTFSGSDVYHVDLESARIPLLRGMEAGTLTDKNDSFEGMFGANLQTIFSEDDYTNASGVSTRLLSSYWQCFYKKNNLDVIDELCDKFFNQCFLNKEVELLADPDLGIPASTFTYLGIKKRLDELIEDNHPDLIDVTQEEKNAVICSDLYGNEQTELDVATMADLNLSRAAIERVNLDLDNLYRLGFLVLVPSQSKASNKFSFSGSRNVGYDKDDPVFVAFKMPEFGTNKSRLLNNFDSLELTKMVLQSQEQNEQDLADQNQFRSQLLETTQNLDRRSLTNTIRCTDGQCADPLPGAIIDIINATAPQCNVDTVSVIDLTGGEEKADLTKIIEADDVNLERAGDIYTPADPLIDDGTARELYKTSIFNSNQTNEELVNTIPVTDDSHGFSWQITIGNVNPDMGDKVKVRAYLVLPMGETIKDVNKSLGVFWSADTILDLVKSNVLVDMNDKTGAIPKYYTLKGSDIRFSDSASHVFDTECEEKPIIGEDGEYVLDEFGEIVTETICQQQTFGVNVTDSRDEEILFPDFGLGWLIRQIQTTIRSTTDYAYDYIASCNRVEDLFLGRCAGVRGGQLAARCDGQAFAKVTGLPEYSDIPNQAKSYFSEFIVPKITPELVEAYGQAQAATGIPCEIIAGIHYIEGGMSPEQSVFDGAKTLRGGNLAADATAAMEHFKDKLGQSGVAPAQVELNFENLVQALSDYNGGGNANCSSNDSGYRPTRWRNNGWCPADFYGDDHIYPLSWIDEEHLEMDLIFCKDSVEFTCNRPAQESDREAIRNRYEQVMGSVPSEDFITNAMEVCFEGPYSNACAAVATNNNQNKYPAFAKPGVLTIAIIFNSFEEPVLTSGVSEN